MEYMVHLNHEETMMSLVNSEGSFWRDMRYVGVPGIDNLNQIGPGIVADFPKLAGSAAHLFGRSLVWEEEGGGPGQSREVRLRLPTRPRCQLHEHPRPQLGAPPVAGPRKTRPPPSVGTSAAPNT